MTLIIGARCKDGCLVIADKRSHISTGGVLTYDDTFEKVVLNKGYIVYNHGYNRIHDADWKLCRDQLIPDKDSPIYQAIAAEMKSKEDKTACYVFMNKRTMYEVKISATGEVRGIDHLLERPSPDLIVSGTGEKYVDRGLLTDLQRKKCKKAISVLEKTFRNAYAELVRSGGDEFCSNYTTKYLFD